MKFNYKKFMSIFLSFILIVVYCLFDNALSVSAENTEDTNNDNDPVIVVSLGDSYSSGEGNPPFYGQDYQTNEMKSEEWLAHRSPESWPAKLEIPNINGTMKDYYFNKYSMTSKPCIWYFKASSGAVIDDLLGTPDENGVIHGQKKTYTKTGYDIRHKNEKTDVYLDPQLDIFKDIAPADYVTLTIGGNDLNFAGIVTTCALGSSYLEGPAEYQHKYIDRAIENDWINYNTNVQKKLRKAYHDIQNAAGSQAEIIVVGYPQLFDKDGKGFLISKYEATKVNNAVSEFNKKLNDLVGECEKEGMKISFVDVETEFSADGGHGAYSDDPWINPIILGAQKEDLDKSSIVSAYSIHPNSKGTDHYAKCVNEKIKELEAKKKNENMASGNRQNIPEDAAEYNGHSYYIYRGVCETWEDAESYCEDKGGHLAIINDDKENKFLYDFMKKSGYENAYFGLTDSEEEGVWKCVNGTEAEYENWSDGEPNNEGGDENYAMFYYKSPEYKWNDGNFGHGTANDDRTFICEWDNAVVTSDSAEKDTYLEDAPIVKSDQYSENEGDSFVYTIGKHEYTRGNTDINGNSYSHGIEGWIARWNYKDEKSWAYSVFDVGGKYKKVKGKCVLIDSYNTDNFDTQLEFYGDGKLLKSYHLTPESIPFDINLDISGIKELKIYFKDNVAKSGGTSFGLTEMKLQ